MAKIRLKVLYVHSAVQNANGTYLPENNQKLAKPSTPKHIRYTAQVSSINYSTEKRKTVLTGIK